MTRLLAAACAAMLLAACGGGNTTQNQNQQTSAPASPGAAAPAAAAVDPATAATVTGKVKFEGTAPAPTPIKLGSDPYCEKASPGLTTENEIAGKDASGANACAYG